MNNLSRKELRQIMRARRRDVSIEVAQSAAKQLAVNVLRLSVLQNCQHVAGYLANDGEISTDYIAKELEALSKSYYLPVLDAQQTNHLIFIQYRIGDALKLNRYKIPEPDVLGDKRQPPELLDLVFVPVVAFDEQGGRLGMGKGYYDHTFEFVKSSAVRKPLLVGLAYEFQRIEQLKSEPWDVPLDGIITEEKVYKI